MVAPPTPFMVNMTKTELRSLLRQRRNAFRAGDASPFPVLSELIRKIERAQCVGSYCSLGSEPDMIAVNHMIQAQNIELALPRVDGRGSVMTFHRWALGDALERAAFGFYQPPAAMPIVKPDLLLVPLLGFDREMARIGQGAGHYDRYFERHPGTIKIGIGWSVQEVERLVVDPWDIAMDAVCTEKDWISATNSAKAIA
jgi:5-formyltetrahydrofolate cyclo-ligase